MIDYNDDMDTEEATREALGKTEAAEANLSESLGVMQDQRHSEEEASNALLKAERSLEDLIEDVRSARAEVDEAVERGDVAYDGFEEAQSMILGLPDFIRALGDESPDDDPSSVEIETTLDGTPIRVRIDTLEESETGAPIHNREPDE